MKNYQLVFIIVLVSSFGGGEFAQGTILFDNGSFSGTQEQRNNACQQFGPAGCSRAFTVYEDFTLTSDSTISGIQWSQHELDPNAYLRTNLSFFSGIPSDTTHLLSMTVTAIRSLNATPVLPSGNVGVDNVVSGLSINLVAGTYWFGINNDITFGVTNWDQTIGNSSTIPGRFQGVDAPNNFPQGIPGPNGSSIQFHPNENSVFRIIGTKGAIPEPIPEPSTMLLLGSGLVGLIGYRMKKAQG